MPVDRRLELERVEQRIGAAGGIEPRERLRDAGEAGAGEDRAAGERALRGLRPDGRVGGEVVGGDRRRRVPSISSSSARRSSRCRPTQRPRRARARVRVTSPGCSSRSPSPSSAAAGRVDRRALAHRHHRLEHREARRVRRRHRDARRARAAAPARRARGHGSRPCARHSASSPAGRPGTAHDDAPIA